MSYEKKLSQPIKLIGIDKYPFFQLISYFTNVIIQDQYKSINCCKFLCAIQYIILYLQSLLKQFMKEQIEKVKILTLRDNKNKEEKYMLTCLLGKGKYGKVYKAVHVDNPNKIFAVKVMTLKTEKVKEQCLKQLQIIRHLPKSLNLVQIHSQHLQSENNFYIFEEYCDGGNLLEQKRARNGKPYNENQVFNLFFQIVTGFIQLRKNNIFHQDIKPENILIKNNLYKIADFGISQLAGSIQVSAIRKGTLIYMPPQKLKGQTFSPTSKTEIFSLGVTLYEMIFGQHPYLRKKPEDYRQYLKIIQQTQLKQLNKLKIIFPSASLSIDRLIRIILRMIDISEAKRLSLQELEDYIKNTQPFKSMVVSEIEPMAKKKNDKVLRYEQVGHSYVYVKSQNGIGSLLTQSSKEKKKEKLKQILSLYNQILKIFREISAYLQQGIFYCKNSNIHELKKIQSSSTFDLNKITCSQELQFVILLLIQHMFTQLERITSKFMFSVDFQFPEGEALMNGIGQDKDFVKNQFLNFYLEIQVEDKKGVWTNLKEKKNIANLAATELTKISSSISCVRINFKQDMLAFLFSLQCPKILNFTQTLLDNALNSDCGEQTLQDLERMLRQQTKQVVEMNNIIGEYNRMQTLKRQKVYVGFHEAVRGHEILQDDETNSDQFQVLSLEDI